MARWLQGVRLLLLFLALHFGSTAAALAANGEVVAQIKSRGILRCGVSEGIPGLSAQDTTGRWTGLDVDFCRAVAAAVLGDQAKVEFVSLLAAARLPALQAGRIDLLSRNTTWTLAREAGVKVQFAGILFYDGQGLMVRAADASPVAAGSSRPAAKAPGARAAQDGLAHFNGATVCVKRGTNHGANLTAYFAARGLEVELLTLDSAADLASAFFAGRCRALSSDASQLAALRLNAPGGADAFPILPERISKEPLGPAMLRGDDDWLTLVRWVLFTLIAAEEYGVTRDNAQARMADPEVQRLWGGAGAYGKDLGVDAEWASHALRSVGNYGEMFERNVGSGSPLRLERGLNRPWTEGGLMYAPPVR